MITLKELGKVFFTPGEDVSNNLLAYLADSSSSGADYEQIYDLLKKRTPSPSKNEAELKIRSTETTVFKVRFDLMETNHRAYRIAIKPFPTVEELEEFGTIKPCWSTLFPIRAYLMDHPEIAQKYQGFLPFGKDVAAFYDAIVPDEKKIGTRQPNVEDHCNLQEVSNWMAKHTGWTSAAVNVRMYLLGKKLHN